jgi:N-acyl-D-amino-acid deacylase
MHSRLKHRATVLTLMGWWLLAARANGGELFDVVIRHGTVIDGSGRPGYAADIGVRNGYIVRIGDLRAAAATLEIDATGRFVTPGFINIHSHADADALPTAANMLAQGVTTEILYPDGDGPTDIAAELHKLEAAHLAENIGGYIGFNGVWESVMGQSDHRAEPGDISKMRGLVERGLRQGAWGISAGLDYKPAYFATTDEVVEVVSAGAPWRTNFPNHERITPPDFSSRAGIGETIRIGTQAGVAPEITHIKAQGHEQGRGPEIVATMTQASRSGHYTPADVYPYLAGLTGLQDLLIPGWAQDGGPAAMRTRFKDPQLREKIARESEAAMNARLSGGAQGVQLPQLNKSLIDVMQAEHVSAGEAVIRTLEKAGDQEIYALLQFGAESDVEAFLRYDGTAVACDCGATLLKLTHPRYYGTFPRVLSRYVRDKKVLTWEQAIEKMTALPANTVGMVDRGLLSVGMHADVTVLDPATVADHSTYTQPSLMPEGIREVLVNGHPEWHAGSATGTTAGKAVFRSRHMPTRQPSFNRDRRVHASASIALVDDVSTTANRYQLTLDIHQAVNAPHATGSVRVDSAGKNARLDLLDFGELQVGERWVSLTGMARWAGRIEPVTLILDAADPDSDRAYGRLIVESPSRHAEWQLPSSALEIHAVSPASLQ